MPAYTGKKLNGCFIQGIDSKGHMFKSHSIHTEDTIVAQYEDNTVRVSTGDIYHVKEKDGKLYAC